jgi:hypothetical protein
MNNKQIQVDMLREPYRALFVTGRTYAAFDKENILPLIENLKRHKIIADPMAGFGSLMNYCSEKGISTFNIEYNPPTYLWGVLNNPNNSQDLLILVNALLAFKWKYPKVKKRAIASPIWFPSISYDIILNLYEHILNSARMCIDVENAEEKALSILIPFVGRLGCYVPGNIVAYVKEGGICLYDNIIEDFGRYLITLKIHLETVIQESVNKEHQYIFGDLRNIRIAKKISAFITSPPYPNSRDYYNMFRPENECILFLKSKGFVQGLTVNEQLISCVSVSKYLNKDMDNNLIISDSARGFIDYIKNYKATKRAVYDNKIYYLPYFITYFRHIEQAYTNFAKYLTKNCDGYIIVTNNTARNKVVPVAESIVELFTSLGFNANIDEKYTRELSHVGDINPKVKGFKARHMEYTVHVSKGSS